MQNIYLLAKFDSGHAGFVQYLLPALYTFEFN